MKRVVVGLSGGVDSVLLLVVATANKDMRVIEVFFMKNWHDDSTISNDCPWLEDK
jgi:tRNA U34 2-thiouridine synthase MnmA/TrmU